MAEESWTAVSITFHSESVLAREIEQKLGVKAARTAEIGELVSQRSPSAGRREKALCAFESPLNSEAKLRDHVAWVFEFLTQHEPTIAALPLCDKRVRLSHSCASSGQGALAIECDDLALLVRLNVSLDIDIFPADES